MFWNILKKYLTLWLRLFAVLAVVDLQTGDILFLFGVSGPYPCRHFYKNTFYCTFDIPTLFDRWFCICTAI